MNRRPIEIVLDRLDGVRKSGRGWIAKCPAHDDGRPSLSLAEGEKGAAVLNCFAGCHFTEIVHALELQPSDLFPDRSRPLTGAKRTERGHSKRAADVEAAIATVEHEALVVLCGANDIADGQQLSCHDRHRYAQAVGRITSAREALRNG